MALSLPTPTDAPLGPPVRPRGVLSVAAPAPEGWELGGVTFSAACPDPLVENKCVYIGGYPGSRPTVSAFPTFLIEQLVHCSTLSGEGRDREARDALSVATDYALGLTLYSGEANDAASLSDASDVGTFPTAVAALAALECAAAAAGKGLEYTLHASVGAAAYLADAGLIDSNGRSPSGASWIISTGYPCDPTDEDAALTIWATGRVVAAAGEITVDTQIDRRGNNREALAMRSALVAFNPCILVSASFPAVGPDTIGD